MYEEVIAPIYFDTTGGRVTRTCRDSRKVYRFYEGHPELNPVTNPRDAEELRECPDLVEVTQIEGGRWVKRPDSGVRPRRTVMTSDTLAQPVSPIMAAKVESTASVHAPVDGATHPLAAALADEPALVEVVAKEPGVETPPVSPSVEEALPETPVVPETIVEETPVDETPEALASETVEETPAEDAPTPEKIKVKVAKGKKPKGE